MQEDHMTEEGNTGIETFLSQAIGKMISDVGGQNSLNAPHSLTKL